jgi:hypothetical protein
VALARPALLALLALASCGPGEAAPAPAPPPKPTAPGEGGPPPPPVPELAPLEAPPWEDVDPETFLKLADPEPPPALAWDFTAGRRFAYTFTQTVHQAAHAVQGDRKSSSSGRFRNRGTFEFVGHGGSAGVLVTIEPRELVSDGRSVDPEELKKQPPTRFEGTLKEDGTAQVKKVGGSSDPQVFFDGLLALAVGERPLKDGRISTRRAGTFKVGRRDCIRLESEFETASSEPGLRRATKGRVIAYFDPRERRFVRASAAVRGAVGQSAAGPGGVPVLRTIESRTEFRVALLE